MNINKPILKNIILNSDLFQSDSERLIEWKLLKVIYQELQINNNETYLEKSNNLGISELSYMNLFNHDQLNDIDLYNKVKDKIINQYKMEKINSARTHIKNRKNSKGDTMSLN